MNILDELADCKVSFGLVAQGHIPTIESLIEQGYGWDYIAKKIGWDRDTAIQHYQWYVESKNNGK